jgi:chromosome segregation ATPase
MGEQIKDNNYTAVLLEKIEDNLKLLAEGQSNLNEKMDRKFEAVDERFDQINQQFKSIEKKLGDHDQQFKNIEKKLGDHDQQFKTILKYLSRIEDELMELKGKINRVEENGNIDRKEIEDVKVRLEKVEEALKNHKIFFQNAAKKGV